MPEAKAKPIKAPTDSQRETLDKLIGRRMVVRYQDPKGRAKARISTAGTNKPIEDIKVTTLESFIKKGWLIESGAAYVLSELGKKVRKVK